VVGTCSSSVGSIRSFLMLVVAVAVVSGRRRRLRPTCREQLSPEVAQKKERERGEEKMSNFEFRSKKNRARRAALFRFRVRDIGAFVVHVPMLGLFACLYFLSQSDKSSSSENAERTRAILTFVASVSVRRYLGLLYHKAYIGSMCPIYCVKYK